MTKLAVISLGCDKNRVDTENMLYYLSKGNYSIVNDFEQAEIIIINTCAFIESARQESIDEILQCAEFKKTGNCKKLIVTGCLPQKYKDELISLLPEVDAFLGIDEYEKIISLISDNAITYIEKSNQRILTTPPHYAFLKIADGCDNHCTFCTIPSIRGKYRSREIESLYNEAKNLVDNGVEELILVAQDVTRYGIDLYGRYELLALLKKLSSLNVRWIRLMYCYPELVTDDLIEEIATNPKIVKYIDVPMQHVSDSILKKMNRRSTSKNLIDLTRKLQDNNIVMRTTFMVGFPGESEEDFNKLKEFIVENPMRNVGIFAYSKESETASAKLNGHIPKAEKLKRVNILGKLISLQVEAENKKMIGQVVQVLYEDIDYERKMFVGRTALDAPEIDRKVYFDGNFADVGKIYDVLVTDYDGYDLIGKIITN